MAETIGTNMEAPRANAKLSARSIAVGALAIGSQAVGALALGAVAIGRTGDRTPGYSAFGPR